MKYITRIELHSANADDYTILHNAMKYEGFSTEILDDNNIRYYLPTAEYLISENNIDYVFSKAQNAISKTNKKYSLIVFEWTKAKWIGLDKVTN